MKPKSQKEALMLLLKKGQPINWVKAFTTTGCSKLSTRIAEFIQQGYKIKKERVNFTTRYKTCLLYTSPSPRDGATSRMPSSA